MMLRTYKRIIVGGMFLISLLFFPEVLIAQNAVDTKSEIYSKIRDRRCSNDTINECNCPDAKEMRSYVDNLLMQGMNQDDIFYNIAKKYSLSLILDPEAKSKVEKRLIKEAGKKRPQISFEQTAYDFGEVARSQGKINKTLKVFNKGNVDLIISNIRVSCGCVTASMKKGKTKSPDFGVMGATPGWRQIIEPGKSAELEIILDLNHFSIKPGKVIRDIFVSSNDPVYQESTIKIMCFVK